MEMNKIISDCNISNDTSILSTMSITKEINADVKIIFKKYFLTTHGKSLAFRLACMTGYEILIIRDTTALSIGYNGYYSVLSRELGKFQVKLG